MRSMLSLVPPMVVLSALCLVAAPAHALATASATISSLRMELIDLDPNDGVAPGITFGRSTWYPDVSHMAVESAGARDSRSAPVGTAMAATIEMTQTFSSAAITAGDFFGTGPSPTATVLATTEGTLPCCTTALAVIFHGRFLVTPHTRVVVTATGSVDVSATVAGEGGYSTVFVELSQTATSYRSFAFMSHLLHLNRPPEVSGNSPMVVSFTNVRNHVVEGDAIFRTSAQAIPIPEPGTYALMLAGLGIVGFVARRQASALRT